MTESLRTLGSRHSLPAECRRARTRGYAFAADGRGRIAVRAGIVAQCERIDASRARLIADRGRKCALRLCRLAYRERALALRAGEVPECMGALTRRVRPPAEGRGRRSVRDAFTAYRRSRGSGRTRIVADGQRVDAIGNRLIADRGRERGLRLRGLTYGERALALRAGDMADRVGAFARRVGLPAEGRGRCTVRDAPSADCRSGRAGRRSYVTVGARAVPIGRRARSGRRCTSAGGCCVAAAGQCIVTCRVRASQGRVGLIFGQHAFRIGIALGGGSGRHDPNGGNRHKRCAEREAGRLAELETHEFSPWLPRNR